MTKKTETIARWTELATMFFAGPLLYWFIAPRQGWLFPALWCWGLLCLVLLLRDRSFDRTRLGGFRAAGREARPMLALFAALALLIGLAVWAHPGLELFALPRRAPVLWAAIMVLYPVFSVFPQEVVFRAFFFHRYRGLLGDGLAMCGSSALAFGFVHVIFENWIAVVMTVVGGAIFSWRYARSRSLAAACIEHALYGCLVFTIGLGEYFYSGSAGHRRDDEPTPPTARDTYPCSPDVHGAPDAERSAVRDSPRRLQPGPRAGDVRDRFHVG